MSPSEVGAGLPTRATTRRRCSSITFGYTARLAVRLGWRDATDFLYGQCAGRRRHGLQRRQRAHQWPLRHKQRDLKRRATAYWLARRREGDNRPGALQRRAESGPVALRLSDDARALGGGRRR